MVDVRPLRVRIVQPTWAERVSSPAHDSLTPADRRAHLAINPDSYMAVTRGLEDVLPHEEFSSEDLLHQGRSALDRLLQNGAFCAERGDEFYIYQLEHNGQVLTGLVGGVSVQDYISGAVRIHEHVKANRAIHLANHLDVVGVQSSPIAMAHRPSEAVTAIVERGSNGTPLLEVTLPDGLTQRVWAITNDDDHRQLLSVFDDLPLYLIDGHHRAAAAATFRTAAGPGMADWMLSAIFPSDRLENAAHHRIIRPEVGIAEALRIIGRHCRLRRCERDEIDGRKDDEVALHADGAWYLLTLPFADERDQSAAQMLADLDPSRFQAQIVAPLFRLDPEGDDPALSYVAGISDLDRLEALIAAEGGILAVMRQVPIESLVAAADNGLVMPPKSTYFEPKVRSGVFLRPTTE